MDELTICNLALRHLGQNKITSLTGNSPSQQICSDFFDPCRDDVLREHQWSFANVQCTLSESAVEAPLGWEFAYDCPTENCAAIWLAYNEATYNTKDEQDFDTFYDPTTGKKLLCSNLDDIYIEYTHTVEDPNSWDAKFVMALSYRLAAEIAPFLTGDDKKALTVMTIYNNIINEAKRVDSSVRQKKPVLSCPAQEARG